MDRHKYSKVWGRKNYLSVDIIKTIPHPDDFDEFVEEIPYAETQNYIKKVFKTYWNYLNIYDKID